MTQFVFNNSTLVARISLFYVNFSRYLNIIKELRGQKLIIEKVNIAINRMKELYNRI